MGVQDTLQDHSADHQGWGPLLALWKVHGRTRAHLTTCVWKCVSRSVVHHVERGSAEGHGGEMGLARDALPSAPTPGQKTAVSPGATTT